MSQKSAVKTAHQTMSEQRLQEELSKIYKARRAKGKRACMRRGDYGALIKSISEALRRIRKRREGNRLTSPEARELKILEGRVYTRICNGLPLDQPEIRELQRLRKYVGRKWDAANRCWMSL